MCDYSLEMYASRPAREGERYVTTRFRPAALASRRRAIARRRFAFNMTPICGSRIFRAICRRAWASSRRKRLFSRALNMALIATAYVSRTARKSRLQLLGSGVGASLTVVEKPVPAPARTGPQGTCWNTSTNEALIKANETGRMFLPVFLCPAPPRLWRRGPPAAPPPRRFLHGGTAFRW